MDNLNTHTTGAFYETFTPEKARDYLQRLRFVYTPKHGSWLNIAECELSRLTRQCLSCRRIGDLPTLRSEVSAWASHINKAQTGVDWQFKIQGVRVKLLRLYPIIKTG